MKKIVFIAKTNLNNDGRILNQIKILNMSYKNKMVIDFLLLPDKPLSIELDDNVRILEINPFTRNSKFLRPLIVLEFTIKSLIKLIKLRPEVIHIQDFAVVLPVYIYKSIFGRKSIVIYDDHEMPNENESFQYRLLQFFERKIMKKANIVIYANKERQEILDKELNLVNNTYFLNLPYFEETFNEYKNLPIDLQSKFNSIKSKIEDGHKIIVHQGLLEVERGREKLANLSKRISNSDYHIMLLGISYEDFESFVKEYDLDIETFIYVGSVPYKYLDMFWKLSDVAVVMYLPTYINNRLCAPNRYFIALKNSIPTLVNRDNPVLFNFTEKYESGFYIEDIKDVNDLESVSSHSYQINLLENLKSEEINKLLSIYEGIL